MNFEISTNSLDKISADGLILFRFLKNSTNDLDKLDRLLNGFITKYEKAEDFKAKIGESIAIYSQDKILSPKVFIVGLDDKEKFNLNVLRKALAIFAKGQKNKLSSLALSIIEETDIDPQIQAQAIVEGITLGSYQFNKYKKTEEHAKELELVTIAAINKNINLKLKEGIKHGQIYCSATKLVRDLVNEPASFVTPTLLADIALDLAKENKEISCTVFDRKDLEKMGMGAFLGIAQGADTDPKFIHLEYSPKNTVDKKKKLALVGKGITFDTGGISIKPDQHMQNMKIDMAGAAIVLGVFSVISQIKPNFSVMGLIASTPNMISGKSIVPGDVLKALNGKTIEVLNTDAEGRVTMADSLAYAVENKATEILDFATLTGACAVALGEQIAGLFGNNEKLKDKFKKAAFDAGEKIWELPLEEDYRALNKSEVADISNIPSTRYGGAITAALFLEEFVDKKAWIHVDIAGPTYFDKGWDLGPKGATAFGVRTVLNFLKES